MGLHAGEHSLVVEATDQLGLVGLSEALEFVVNDPPGQAVYLHVDDQSQGYWENRYGMEAVWIHGSLREIPEDITVSPRNGQLYIGSYSSALPGALRWPGDPHHGVVAEWNHTDNLEIQVHLRDGREHLLALYLCDFTGNYRRTILEVLDNTSRGSLDTREIGEFGNGKYILWKVRGNILLRFQRKHGGNVGFAGLFLDSAHPRWALWQAVHFGPESRNPLHSNLWHEDPDGDGFPNLLEHVMGTLPNQSDPLQFLKEPGGLALRFPEVSSDLGFKIIPEFSTNLVDWIQGEAWYSKEVQVQADGKVISTVRPSLDTSRGYIRLKLEPSISE